MIRHIVFFKFKPETTDTQIEKLEFGLSSLPAMIPQIKSFEFGRDIVRSDRSYDFALNSAFDSLEAMNEYQVHPAHIDVVTYVKEICREVVAADYEF